MTSLFLDLLGKLAFHMTREEALTASVCVRCKRPVTVEALADVDSREYRISSFCPECFAEVMTEDEE